MTNILHNIIHCITLNRADAIGIKIIIFQLFGISVTCFGDKGADITSAMYLTNIEFSFQLLPKLLFNRILPKKEYVHFCEKCGPFVKGYSELWEKGSSAPFKIEFFQYNEGSIELVDEIVINSYEKNKPILIFNYCGICNGLMKNKFFTKNDIAKIMKRQRGCLS